MPILDVIDITGYPLIPLEKNEDETYPFPRMRYGILPYHINSTDQIIWGCVESNRVGPITLSIAAGTQDIIAIKDSQRLVFEAGKPLPDQGIEGLLVGQAFREQVYQDTLQCLATNGFNLYLENPLATAIHEANEEHGIDLCKMRGRDKDLLRFPIDQSPNISIPGQQGVATLCVWLPELIRCESILLRHTDKVDRKMRRNFGRAFYEQGCWVTTEEFAAKLCQEKEKFACLEDYEPVRAELITETFKAFELHLQFINSIESTIRAKRHPEQQDSLESSGVSIFEQSSPTLYTSPHVFFNSTGITALPSLAPKLSGERVHAAPF